MLILIIELLHIEPPDELQLCCRDIFVCSWGEREGNDRTKETDKDSWLATELNPNINKQVECFISTNIKRTSEEWEEQYQGYQD